MLRHWLRHGLVPDKSGLGSCNAPSTDRQQRAYWSHICPAGGLGDLGSLVAAWLAQSTRLHVFLLGRSSRTAKRGASRWIPPAAEGTCVTAVQCDIGRAEDVADLRAQLAGAGPLCAVLHAGGALQDGTIGKQGTTSVRTAFAGKLQARLMSPECCYGKVQLVQPMPSYTKRGRAQHIS